MDISSKLSVSFTPADAKDLFRSAVVNYLQVQFGIVTAPENIDITFKTTKEYDQFDRGPGMPAFAGVDVAIKQPAPKKPIGPIPR